MAEKKNPRPRPFQDLIPDEAFDHARSARMHMRKSMEALCPPGFVENRRAARKEFMKAIRSVLDAAIERMEARE